MSKNINRRSFLKTLTAGTVVTAAALTGCTTKKENGAEDEYSKQVEPPKGKMTYRINPTTKDRVSLLGYGMMRLPNVGGDAQRNSDKPLDQKMINKLVDYALEHGVNYFDTSPAYSQGQSETATGIALKRHPRKSYFIATKLSNFSEETWSREASIEMYHNSLKALQTNYIDYYLLHGVGMGGFEQFKSRYIDNGIIDYLVGERKAGRIRNLGFSFHGDYEAFKWLMDHHDKYHWDFVQIELNYLDWDYANEINDFNTDARVLYGELQKRGIPAVIMEPLLGGRLSNIPQYLVGRLKQREPQRSVASWAFRYAGTHKGVLTVLSGMTYMEHLKDNLISFCPLKPLTADEEKLLYSIAKEIFNLKTIPCNDCKYCMPCPWGVDIPTIFVHYNKCINEGTLPHDTGSKDYRRYRREYLIGLDRVVPRERQPDHCIGCGHCLPHCPQNIQIPEEMAKLSEFIDGLKRGDFKVAPKKG
ncbi:MAG: aldo/keto reductase [Prevotella sp.]|jgi:predicted aldo/keto reductase-like oxidoreductase